MTELDAKKRSAIPTRQFAFPKERKEPLENASHVRNAIARFNQVQDVSDAERAAAWKRILGAAKKYGVEVSEGARPQARADALKPSAAAKGAGKKAAAGKSAAKKTPAKKTAAKKTATRKVATKRVASKKTATKKVAAKRAVATEAAAKKTSARKTTSR